MPRIKPTSKADRVQLRRKLDTDAKKVFDQLAERIDAPEEGLVWHHEVGQLAGKLCSPDGPNLTLSDLEKALGPSAEFFQKSVRFYSLYKEYKVKAIQELEDSGIGWTRLYISFAVDKEEDRHALLRRAIDEGWSNHQLRLTVQEQRKSKRGGIGGRRRKKLTPHGPEVALHEMNRLSRRWIENYDQTWKPVTAKQWEELLPGQTAKQIKKLQKLLSTMVKSVQELSRRCTKMEGKLTGLLTEVKKQS